MSRLPRFVCRRADRLICSEMKTLLWEDLLFCPGQSGKIELVTTNKTVRIQELRAEMQETGRQELQSDQ